MKDWKTGSNKLQNAFDLLRILSSTKIITAREIGGSLNISPRSVYRLVDELTIIGFPINTTRGRVGGGIWLSEDFKRRLNSASKYVETVS